MRFLREQLDDPAAADCGRCDNCGGLTLADRPRPGHCRRAPRLLSRPGVAFDPRRMWPSAMAALGVPVRGKIAPAEQAEAGRAVARFTDLGFGAQVRAALTSETPDAAVSDELVAAAVRVLAGWDWPQRPEVILAVGSRRRPQLVSSIAARLGEIGRLPQLDPVEHLGPSAGSRSNSALRLRDVWGSYRLPDSTAAGLDGRRVLLVDDLTDTGWTLTVVTRLLREAGATAVYPFVLGIAA